jgi:hypothetical protein
LNEIPQIVTRPQALNGSVLMLALAPMMTLQFDHPKYLPCQPHHLP